MRTASQQSGFTIVETVIVLTITALLFALAFTAIDGKQNITEFQQAMGAIQATIQQTANQVSSGEYDNTGNFTCTDSSGKLTIKSGSNLQGSNTGCIYLGKAIQFAVKGKSPQQYITYTIAGLQGSVSSVSTDFSSAKPTAIAPGTNNNKNYPNASVQGALHNGLTVVSMKSFPGGSQVGTVAFISGFGKYSGGSGSTLISGQQTFDLIPVQSSSLGQSSGDAVDKINKNLATSPQNPSGGVEICFLSGGTNQIGIITIGSNNRGLSVTSAIKDSTNWSKDCP